MYSYNHQVKQYKSKGESTMKIAIHNLDENRVQYTSETFDTLKESQLAVKQIKQNILELLETKTRAEVRIPNGIIHLQGLSSTGNWITLTSTIGRFKHHLDSDIWNDYRLASNELYR